MGELGPLPRAREGRADDVRPDDRGVLDLHRDPGHPPGHVRDVRRARAPALRRDAPRARRPDRGPRRHGRRPAARRDDERGRLPRDRGRPGAGEAPPRHRLRRSADRVDPTRRCRWRAPPPPTGEAVSIALVGNAAEIEPAWAKAGERFDVVTDQTSAHDALVGYVPAEISLDDAALLREHQPDEYVRRSTASMAAHVRAMLDVPAGRRGRLRLRQQPPRAGEGRRRRRRVRLPGLRARVHPAAVLRGPRAVPLGGAVRRPGRHPPDRPGDPRALPRGRVARPLDHARRGARAVPGPAGADLLARLRRAGEGRARRSTSWSGRARSPRRS